jgi:hypothetical protein
MLIFLKKSFCSYFDNIDKKSICSKALNFDPINLLTGKFYMINIWAKTDSLYLLLRWWAIGELLSTLSSSYIHRSKTTIENYGLCFRNNLSLLVESILIREVWSLTLQTWVNNLTYS